MSAGLDRPASADDLYIARGDVPPWRPVLQGDVFTDVRIAGLEEQHDVMLVSHPCTMRGPGGHLKPVLSAVPVQPHDDIPLERWATGHFRVMPLPSAGGGAAQEAAKLDYIGMVPSDQLGVNKRRASLSEEGMMLLQQRFVFCLTRAVISLDTLMEAASAVLAEAELQEEWNEHLAKARVTRGESLDDVLRDETARFTAFMAEPAGEPRRQALMIDRLRAGVRRDVRAEIESRLNQTGR